MLRRRVRVRRRSTGVHITRKQRFTLVAAILGSSVAAIDGTIVNVALPAIQDDLGGGLQAQQWISNAYLLTLGSLILIGGSLGDIYGKRRVFAIGVGCLRRSVARLCGGADGRDADRGASPAGRCGRAADAELAGDHRRGVLGARARRGDRLVDGLGRDRGRSSARSPAA